MAEECGIIEVGAEETSVIDPADCCLGSGASHCSSAQSPEDEDGVDQDSYVESDYEPDPHVEGYEEGT